MRIPPLGLIMHSCINFPSLLSPALPTLCSLANCCQLLTYFADWPHCCCWRPHSPAASSPPHCSSLLRSGGSTTVPSNDADWCRSRHHVKSPRVSRNCCLLRPFAKAAALDPHRWSSTGRRSGGGPAQLLQLQHPITTLSSD